MLYRYRMRLDEPGVRAELGFLYDGYHRQMWLRFIFNTAIQFNGLRVVADHSR